MYEVDFSKPIHIHFIGIGGISMSGLAEILLKENFTISGSDAKESDLTRHLTSLGAQVKILGNGELTKKLNVQANAFSASAKEKIEALGGTAEVI